MLKASLHVLFALAWAVLAFEVIRSFVIILRIDRRIAAAIGISVCGAFFLGATGPLAWSIIAPAANVESAAITPPATLSPTVQALEGCSSTTVLSAKAAFGFVDAVSVGTNPPARPNGPIVVQHSAKVGLVGWAALEGGPGKGVCLIVDGHPMRTLASYGNARPDVAAATRIPADSATGYTITFSGLKPGTHKLRVGVLEASGNAVDPLPETVQVNSQ